MLPNGATTNAATTKPSRMSGGQRPREEEVSNKEGLGIDSWEYWVKVGGTLSVTSKVVMGDGKAYTKQECYAKAVEIDPTQSIPWYNVGSCLPKGSSVTISGTVYTKQACYVNALEINPSLSTAWNNCGSSMSDDDDEHIIVWGTAYSKKACFVKAVQLHPTDANAWANAASCLLEGETITVGERAYTEQECNAKAIDINPRQLVALYNLGVSLEEKEGGAATVTLEKSGTVITRKYCFLQILRCDVEDKDAWSELANCMDEHETVVVGDTDFSKEHCLARGQGISLTEGRIPH